MRPAAASDDTEVRKPELFQPEQNLNTGRVASDFWSTAFFSRTLFISIFVDKKKNDRTI